MECAVRLAEINNDTQAAAQEQIQYEFEIARWKMYVEQLLDGVTIEENGCKYSLAERMANEYQYFADKVDNDIDFMAEFLAGEYGENLNNLFKREARALASIICGV